MELELVEIADPNTGKKFYVNIPSGVLYTDADLPPLAKL